MGAIKAGVSIVVGLLILVSFVGYSSSYDAPGVPKPTDGVCGVTVEEYSDVPGSGAFLDIDVDIAWNDEDVWVGIISKETYDSLTTTPGNEKGKLVNCDATIDYLAGGPDLEEDAFNWQPTGESFHIMIGSKTSGDDGEDGGDDGNGGILPCPPNCEVSIQSFSGEFDVTVDGDVSGGWGIILILILIEIGAVYATALDR